MINGLMQAVLMSKLEWSQILTIRRFLSYNYIRVNVGMDDMTIGTPTNSSFNAHQAVFLHHNDT